MTYKYDPQKFWSSIDRIKGVKAELIRLPPSMRRKLRPIVYRAMEAARRACMATINQEEFPQNNYERDMETDREFLEETIGSFNHTTTIKR